jgi:hypothetical protein
MLAASAFGRYDAKRKGDSGACVAFALTAIAEYFGKKLHGINYRLSPQYLYDLRCPQRPGMPVQDGGTAIKKNGVCPDVDAPFNADKPESMPTHFTPQIRARAKPFKPASFYLIEDAKSPRLIAEAKACLYDVGPVLMSAPIYTPCAPGGQFWKPSPTGSSKTVGGHAFVVDGYDSKGFHVRNSWGPKWNRNGHTLLPYSDVDAVESLLVLLPDKEAVRPVLAPTMNAHCGNTEEGAFQRCVNGLVCCGGRCLEATARSCDFWSAFSDGSWVQPLDAVQNAPPKWKPVVIGVSVAVGALILIAVLFWLLPKGRAYIRLPRR